MLYNKCKDVSPRETIFKIREILNSLGILTKEKWKDAGIDGVFSVRLELLNTFVGTNGKGTSEEYALASAYAELMERMSNNFLFKSSEWESCGSQLFSIFPDEELIDTDLYLRDNIMVNNILKDLSDKSSKNYLETINTVEELRKHKNEKKRRLDCFKNLFAINNKFKSIPFTNLDTEEKLMFPVCMKSVYGSNGMAAGNSYEEAIVQAVSEVFERFCFIKIIEDKIVPPDIDRALIKEKFTRVYGYIYQIEKKGNYRVRVRDCSLGLKYPVVCTTIYNKDACSSITIFGAHPNISIAMERTLTEIFQGRDLDENWNKFSSNTLHDKYNIISLFRNYVGTFPDEFHSDAFSYSVNPEILLNKFSSNPQMLNCYQTICKKNKLQIFVRDNSNLGFTAVHVIIPGMSEICRYDQLSLNVDIMKRKAPSILNNISAHNKDEVMEALAFLDFARKISFLEVHFSNDYKMTSNRNESINLISLMIKSYYKIGHFDKAIDLIKYARNIDVNKTTFFECLLNTFEIMMRGNLEMNFIRSILSKFYKLNVINSVNKFLEEIDYIDINNKLELSKELKETICNIKKAQLSWHYSKKI